MKTLRGWKRKKGRSSVRDIINNPADGIRQEIREGRIATSPSGNQRMFADLTRSYVARIFAVRVEEILPTMRHVHQVTKTVHEIAAGGFVGKTVKVNQRFENIKHIPATIADGEIISINLFWIDTKFHLELGGHVDTLRPDEILQENISADHARSHRGFKLRMDEPGSEEPCGFRIDTPSKQGRWETSCRKIHA